MTRPRPAWELLQERAREAERRAQARFVKSGGLDGDFHLHVHETNSNHVRIRNYGLTSADGRRNPSLSSVATQDAQVVASSAGGALSCNAN